MGKFFGFFLLWNLFGNPIIAILVLLLIVYLLDRRFVGLFPSVVKPFRRIRQTSKLKQQIEMNPNDVSAKLELGRLLAERKQYAAAKPLLTDIEHRYEQSAEYWVVLGHINLKLGLTAEGEEQMMRGLDINPRVQYGRPYLRLAEALRQTDRDKALHYVSRFQEIQSSSSEAYYLLGSMYKALGRQEEAAKAFAEATAVYRSLPRYKKRQERGWALRSFLAKLK